MAAIVDASTFPLLPISPPIATLSGLAVTERDVFVCSWPKSGTTWMQAIVAHLVAPDRSAWSHVSEVTPFYDAAASWDGAAPAAHLRAAFAARGRRAWNTHVPWSLMPKGARYVYVVRDQRDALVSFWHHLRNQRGDAGTYEGPLAAFAADSVANTEPYGSWAAHVADWSHAVGDASVLVIRYEDMKTDLPAAVVPPASSADAARADDAVSRSRRSRSTSASRTSRTRASPRSSRRRRSRR